MNTQTETYIDDAYASSKQSGSDCNGIPETGPVKVNLVWSGFYTRYPCNVCGGCTEKVAVLAEGPEGLRVCESCLKAGDIDARLEKHIARKEAYVQALRTLIGRLQVPTYQEWLDENDRHWAYESNCSVEEAREKREKRETEWQADQARAKARQAGQTHTINDANLPF
jgi:hypothetical protein